MRASEIGGADICWQFMDRGAQVIGVQARDRAANLRDWSAVVSPHVFMTRPSGDVRLGDQVA